MEIINVPKLMFIIISIYIISYIVFVLLIPLLKSINKGTEYKNLLSESLDKYIAGIVFTNPH